MSVLLEVQSDVEKFAIVAGGGAFSTGEHVGVETLVAALEG